MHVQWFLNVECCSCVVKSNIFVCLKSTIFSVVEHPSVNRPIDYIVCVCNRKLSWSREMENAKTDNNSHSMQSIAVETISAISFACCVRAGCLWVTKIVTSISRLSCNKFQMFMLASCVLVILLCWKSNLTKHHLRNFKARLVIVSFARSLQKLGMTYMNLSRYPGLLLNLLGKDIQSHLYFHFR